MLFEMFYAICHLKYTVLAVTELFISVSLQRERNTQKLPTSWWLYKKGWSVTCYTVYISKLWCDSFFFSFFFIKLSKTQFQKKKSSSTVSECLSLKRSSDRPPLILDPSVVSELCLCVPLQFPGPGSLLWAKAQGRAAGRNHQLFLHALVWVLCRLQGQVEAGKQEHLQRKVSRTSPI